MMTWIWLCLILAAVVCGTLTGRTEELTKALTSGAGDAVTLCLSITGILCFWSGLMEVISESGLSSRIARLLRPILRCLFPKSARDRAACDAISANITANLLGLSNAATPMGLRAAARIHELAGGGVRAGDELIAFVAINTASLQLIPSTLAAVRASLGAENPFDILLCIWVASALSVLTAVVSARALAHLSRKRGGLCRR